MAWNRLVRFHRNLMQLLSGHEGTPSGVTTIRANLAGYTSKLISQSKSLVK